MYLTYKNKTKQKKIENFKGLSFQNTCKIYIKNIHDSGIKFYVSYI